VLKYLESTPCVQETPQNIKNFINRINELEGKARLTKAEKLQFINLAPSNHVEVHLIVEEIEERIDSSELLPFTSLLLKPS